VYIVLCNECGNETKVYDTRIINGERMRYRECKKCGNRFVTQEVIIRHMEPRVDKIYTDDAPDIKTERKRLGFSQEEFAWRAGISKDTIMSAETGKRHPHSKTILKITKAIQEAWEERND
jgi:DNA-binding XRE family transcriptional regulator